MVCYLIKKGVRVDLGFRVKYPKDVAESVRGEDIQPS
jgi:hypothetical protein